MARRRRRALVFVLVLAAADLVLGAALGRDARVAGRPLPPVARGLSRQQRAALEAWVRAGRPETDVVGEALRYDAELGWDGRPGSRSAAGEPFFDARGARARLRPFRGEPDLRVVAFGDSFTYGADVGPEATWPAALERALPGTATVNHGVPGYGTDQALLRFRRLGRGAADVVLLGVLVENVKRNVNRYRPLLYPGASPAMLAKPRFVLADGGLRLVPVPWPTRSGLLRALEEGSARAALVPDDYWAEPEWPGLAWRSGLVRLGLGARRAARTTRRLWQDPDGEPYRVTRALIGAFHDEVRASGAARCVVLLFPTADVLSDGGPPVGARMTADLEGGGVEVLDLQPVLRAAADRVGIEGLYAREHLTARGNAVVARALADRLGAGDQARSSSESSR